VFTSIIDVRGQNRLIWFIGTLVTALMWCGIFLYESVTYQSGEFVSLAMISLITIPVLSFLLFRKTTTLFMVQDEEYERMRQDALGGILGSLNKAYKVLEMMRYLDDLTDLEWKKDQWTDAERATVSITIRLLQQNIRRRKTQKPMREMYPEEIMYLVGQKRRNKERARLDLLKEEMQRRQKEMDLLTELVEAEEDEHPEADATITDIEDDIIEIKKIEKALEETKEIIDIEEETEVNEESDEDLNNLEEEVKSLDEELEEYENEDLEDETKEYDRDVEEEEASEKMAHEPKKKSIRDVISEAMDKMKEDDGNED